MKCEYTLYYENCLGNTKGKITKDLNDLGKNGWEAVNAYEVHLPGTHLFGCLLKREIKDDLT